MFLYRIFNNKYTYKIDILIKNIKLYGLKYTVAKELREKNKSYNAIKKSFTDEKSLKVLYLIEQRLGNKPYIKNAFDMGYCMFGPVIYDFVKWIYDNSSEYNQLWFLSREGWILKKAYDVYSKNVGEDNPKSLYFLASRRATSLAAIKNIEDIKEILSSNYKGGVKNLVKSRLGLDINKDFDISLPEDIDMVMSLVDVDKVIKRANIERKNYINYIGNIEDKIAVVDVGYSGTIQYYLAKLLNKKIDGLYLCSHFNNKPSNIDCNCISLYPVLNLLDERQNKIFKNQLYFEAVLQAPFGQLICFDDKGNSVYNSENTFNDKIKSIQSGIIAFIEQMGVFKEDKKNTLSIEFFDYLIESGNINNELFKYLSVEDKYCSDNILVVKNNSWEKANAK